MTLLRLRAVQLMLAALMAVTPKPYRRELVSCFERLDAEAQGMRRSRTTEEVIQ